MSHLHPSSNIVPEQKTSRNVESRDGRLDGTGKDESDDGANPFVVPCQISNMSNYLDINSRDKVPTELVELSSHSMVQLDIYAKSTQAPSSCALHMSTAGTDAVLPEDSPMVCEVASLSLQKELDRDEKRIQTDILAYPSDAKRAPSNYSISLLKVVSTRKSMEVVHGNISGVNDTGKRFPKVAASFRPVSKQETIEKYSRELLEPVLCNVRYAVISVLFQEGSGASASIVPRTSISISSMEKGVFCCKEYMFETNRTASQRCVW